MHFFYDYTETIGYAFLSVHDRTALSWLVSDCYGWLVTAMGPPVGVGLPGTKSSKKNIEPRGS